MRLMYVAPAASSGSDRPDTSRVGRRPSDDDGGGDAEPRRPIVARYCSGLTSSAVLPSRCGCNPKVVACARPVGASDGCLQPAEAQQYGHSYSAAGSPFMSSAHPHS